MPAITVGLPVFNGQDLIQVAVNSMLGQSFTDFELVICDNASSDETENICRELADLDNRVKYFRNESNIGAAANFRRVVNLASGKYFKWLGVDDFCDSSYLERTKEILDTRLDVSNCCSKVFIVDEKGQKLRKYDDAQHLDDDAPSKRFIQFLAQDSWVNSVYGLMRTQTLKNTSIMGTFPGSDIVVMAEMSLHGKFIELPDYLFYRRIHPAAYSFECSNEKQQDFYNPGHQNRTFSMYHTRHLIEHLRSVFRVPIPFSEKRRLIRELITIAKWRRKDIFHEIRDVIGSPRRG